MHKFTVTCMGGPFDCEEKILECEGDTLPANIGIETDSKGVVAVYAHMNPEGGRPLFEFHSLKQVDAEAGGAVKPWAAAASPFAGDAASEYAKDLFIADRFGRKSSRQDTEEGSTLAVIQF